MDGLTSAILGAAAVLVALPAMRDRIRLSRAKHPSLQGHARMAQRLAKLVPFYEYDEVQFFSSDAAPPEVAFRRRAGFDQLSSALEARAPRTLELTDSLRESLPDLHFTNLHRVPFQYQRHVDRRLKIGSVLEESHDVRVRDLDGNESYDLTGSYGVNLFGYDFYRECIAAGAMRVGPLGPVLGAYHPVIEDNVRRLKAISGLDQVSFHMSGTEAVMQAVRLARYHTGRSHLVRFCGAYHGWWDDVQPGVGTPRMVRDAYTLRDMDTRALDVLESRRDIACVLVNPLQALHPNSSAPGDATLINSGRSAGVHRESYTRWLHELRRVCTERSIVLIFDEVFVGFRLARGGAQEYFGVKADMVAYGKTLGGGLPVGVVCGTHRLMKRFREDRPTDICFARGTFNSHPYVLGAMNEFLRRLDDEDVLAMYKSANEAWDGRARDLNAALEAKGLPVRVANLSSIWTLYYTRPSRYNWMFQYYLRAEGLALSWVGTGRLVFSHNYSSEAFEEVADRFVRAALAMDRDGWWWGPPGFTNRQIAWQVLKEMAAARLRRPSAVPVMPAGRA